MSNVTLTKNKTRHLARKKSKVVVIETPGEPDARVSDAEDNQVIVGSGNIFADLGLPNPEERRAKAQISIRIEELMEEAGLTQAQAALQMGISQPDVSNIVRGRLKGYTLDRLFECLLAMGQEVEIWMPRNRVTKGRGSLLVSCANAASE